MKGKAKETNRDRRMRQARRPRVVRTTRPAKFNILLIADSRGRHFRAEVTQLMRFLKITDIHFEVLFFPGATIEQAATRAIQKLHSMMNFDLIYLLAGVNNLTTFLAPHNTVPVFDNAIQITDHMLAQYQAARSTLITKCREVIICETVGMSMAQYNTRGEPFWEEQKEIDLAMPQTNKGIIAINGFDKFTPRYGSHVHKIRHGRYGSRYSGTLRDGLHYTSTTITKYAYYLIATFYHNLHTTCN